MHIDLKKRGSVRVLGDDSGRLHWTFDAYQGPDPRPCIMWSGTLWTIGRCLCFTDPHSQYHADSMYTPVLTSFMKVPTSALTALTSSRVLPGPPCDIGAWCCWPPLRPLPLCLEPPEGDVGGDGSHLQYVGTARLDTRTTCHSFWRRVASHVAHHATCQ